MAAAQYQINTGTPDGNNGDLVRDAFVKTQDNFTSLFNSQPPTLYRPNAAIDFSINHMIGFKYYVQLHKFIIDGEDYELSAGGTLTLSAADATLSRIDVIVGRLNTTDPANPTVSIEVIEGVLSSQPVEPAINLLTEVKLSVKLILANQTTDGKSTSNMFYDENIEWTNTSLPTGANLDYITGPFNGIKNIYLPAISTTPEILSWSNASMVPLPVSNGKFVFAIKSAANRGVDTTISIKLTNSVSTDYHIRSFSLVNDLLNFGYTFSGATVWDVISIPMEEIPGSKTNLTEFDQVSLTISNSSELAIDWIHIEDGVEEVDPAKDIIPAGLEGVVETGSQDDQNIIVKLGGEDYPVIIDQDKGQLIAGENNVVTYDSSFEAYEGDVTVNPEESYGALYHAGVRFREFGTGSYFVRGEYTKDGFAFADSVDPSLRIDVVPSALTTDITVTLPTGSGKLALTSDIIGGGTELINEGNGNGLVIIGRTAANYGNVGLNAVDLSTSSAASTTKGATGANSTIGGGINSIASGSRSTVAGGDDNLASGVLSTIGGGEENIASAWGATVGGGYSNTSSAVYSTISGGYGNVASAEETFIGGGEDNTASAQYSIAVGGYSNTSSAYASFIGGGTNNTASADYSIVLGGDNNTASGDFSIVAGGKRNEAFSYAETAFGMHSTDYVPASTTAHNVADKIFNIGNGVSSAAKSDALTVLKGGEVLAPSATTALIDAAADSVLTTKEWVVANSGGGGSGGTALLDEGNGDGLVIAGRTAANYGNVGLNAVDLGFNDTTSSTAGATGTKSTLGGGYNNTASGYNSTIAGGSNNTASGYDDTISGGGGNTSVDGGTISGGYNNTIISDEAGSNSCAIGGGSANTVSGTYSTVSGGYNNTISSYMFSTIGGGTTNTISGYGSNTISGGYTNTISDVEAATIGGGSNNTASGSSSTVSGGYGNSATAELATVSGGTDSNATGTKSTVGGGGNHTASGVYSAISGGMSNTASGVYSAVSGGMNNTASGDYAAISGGGFHTASGNYTSIGGGSSNTVSSYQSTVSGGFSNNIDVDSQQSTIGGGTGNAITGFRYSTIGGGRTNSVTALNGTVGGGFDNDATSVYASIGGGQGNVTSGGTGSVGHMTISGGKTNTASGVYSTVTGGLNNTASGLYATAGGQGNTAGDGETVFGQYATAGTARAFAIGAGTVGTPSNVLEVYKSGGIVFNPSSQPGETIAGMMYYDSTSNVFKFYNGTAWLQIQTVV